MKPKQWNDVRSPVWIPYSRHEIHEEDIEAVAAVLRSDWLTTGPAIERLEQAVQNYVGASHAVAVSSGTAALHSAMYALDIQPGDEVLVSDMTFAATVNCILYQGGQPVLVDINPETLLLNPSQAEEKITPHTKAIITTDYAGHPSDYNALRAIARQHGLALVADSCHALGASYHGQQVGQLADITVFSFHPVKAITTGEGGMAVTQNRHYAERMRRFRNHAINADHHLRSEQGTWFYDIVDLGLNYRITDIQCALGVRQLRNLPYWLQRRREIGEYYRKEMADIPFLEPLQVCEGIEHAYHLFVIRLKLDRLAMSRKEIFSSLRAKNIGVNVHYIPIHKHSYYKNQFGLTPDQFPIAEQVYEEILSIPIFPSLTHEQMEIIVNALHSIQ